MAKNPKVKPLVQVRLEPKLHAKLTKLAKTKYQTNAGFVRALIVRHLEEVNS